MSNKKVLIGHCGVDSGQIMICDPCYIDSHWKMGTEMEDWRVYKNKKTGKIYQYRSNIPKVKGAVWFDSYAEAVDKGMSMNDLLEKGLAEEVPNPNDRGGEFSYRGTCATTLSEKADKDGQLVNDFGANVGVVASSGYGDGLYPVYAEFIDEGMGKRVSRLTIDFMGTYTQEYMKKIQKGGTE